MSDERQLLLEAKAWLSMHEEVQPQLQPKGEDCPWWLGVRMRATDLGKMRLLLADALSSPTATRVPLCDACDAGCHEMHEQPACLCAACVPEPGLDRQ